MPYHDANPSAFDDEALASRGPARREEIMRVTIQASMTLVLSMIAGSAGAQFQYTPPGGPEDQPETRKEILDREMELARYRVGRLRIAPWVTLRDVAYVRTLSSSAQRQPSDLTATLGAGFRAYLRNGAKVTWSLGALPEYVWWRTQADRRRVNGRYNIGFHGFFNRLTLEAQAGREQRLGIITPEVPVLASARTDRGEVLTEVEITPAFFVFASTALTERTNGIDEEEDPRVAGFGLLDREERATRLGLRWKPRQRWTIALGAEQTRTDFDSSALARSNSGTAPLGQVRFRGRRVAFETELAARSLEARQGSDFVPYDEVTGSAALRFGQESSVSATIYAGRNLLYSLEPAYAYLQDDRLGASLQIAAGFRTRVRFFGEIGTNDYTAFSPAALPRSDDITSLGSSLDFNINSNFLIGVQALRSEFNSSLVGEDREYTSVGLTVNFFGGR